MKSRPEGRHSQAWFTLGQARRLSQRAPTSPASSQSPPPHFRPAAVLSDCRQADDVCRRVGLCPHLLDDRALNDVPPRSGHHPFGQREDIWPVVQEETAGDRFRLRSPSFAGTRGSGFALPGTSSRMRSLKPQAADQPLQSLGLSSADPVEGIFVRRRTGTGALDEEVVPDRKLGEAEDLPRRLVAPTLCSEEGR